MAKQTTAPPAPEVSLERAAAYFELLCDLGLDEALDAAASAARPERPRGRPVKSMQESAGMVEADQQAGTVQLHMGKILRACGKQGALFRLGAIVLGCTEQQARDRGVEEVKEAYYPFVSASWGLIAMLLDSLSGSG